MIKAVIIINVHGLPRLTKFYQHYPESEQQELIKNIYRAISTRDDDVCNFLESGSLIGNSDLKLVYRHYATLYFVFCVDSSENELGIFDLIQVFVESLDKCFGNVCELDLVFHCDKVHHILNEIIVGGLVLDPNVLDIVASYKEQNNIEKREVGISGMPGRISSKLSENFSQSYKDMKRMDFLKIPNLLNRGKSVI